MNDVPPIWWFWAMIAYVLLGTWKAIELWTALVDKAFTRWQRPRRIVP